MIPIENYTTLLLLTSKFLDKNVDDARNDFKISPEQKENNLFGDFSWEMINRALRTKMKEVLYKKIPYLKQKNEQAFEKLRDNNLHLWDYFGDIEEFVGLVNTEKLIREAEKKFRKQKENFRKLIEEEGGDSEKIIEEASNLAGKELIEYILNAR